ncbi:MAG: hypothetical protein HQK83_15490 [Fibrobacteria bacterium]|nr:hypothetical protein [Fibrobacteria bacterium]
MKKTYGIILASLLCSLVCLSCLSSNEPVDEITPNDSISTGADTFSLQIERISEDALPDTLYTGDSLHCIFSVEDTDGDTVKVSITGLPENFTVEQIGSGSKVFIKILFTADLVQLGQSYTMLMSVNAANPVQATMVDTMTLSQHFIVLASDTLSLIQQSLVATDFPNTLLYGDTLIYTTLFKDHDGKPVKVEIEAPDGITVTQLTTDSGVSVSLNAPSDQLQLDSNYVIKITATGSGKKDSLSVEYNFMVLKFDTFSLVTTIVSLDTIPDTLYYGQTVNFTLRVTDTAGDSVSVAVSGIPSSVFRSVTSTNNMAELNVTLTGDSLIRDSVYTLSILARGSGLMDTVSLKYTFRVIYLDTFSLVYGTFSGKRLPDTLYHGDTSSFVFQVEDTDGDRALIEIGSLPAAIKVEQMQKQGKAFVAFKIFADSLPFDSSYTITLKASGLNVHDEVPIDTVTWVHSLVVLDSTRLGGLRLLAKGSYWLETQSDSIVRVKDTAGTITRIDSVINHRKKTTIAQAGWIGDEYIMQLVTSDSLVDQDSVNTQVMFARHTKKFIEYIMPFGFYFLDTIRAKYYKMPITVGEGWSLMSYEADTAVRLVDEKTSGVIPLQFFMDINGEVKVLRESSFSFNRQNRRGYTHRINNEMVSVALYDSVITKTYYDTRPPRVDTLVNRGDSVASTVTNQVITQFIDPDFTFPFWSDEREVTRNRNFFENLDQVDTIVRHNRVTAFYDARRDMMIVR